MLRVIFFCDIQNEDGDTIEQDFDFDNGVFESREELEKYCKFCDYEIGEPCGYWGNDVGILKEIFVDEEV
ncbi:MAG: hypothetical protein IJQ28_03990 [Clostridia bacterium]|nr:hypothetical protein [Clostridia bacterium]